MAGPTEAEDTPRPLTRHRPGLRLSVVTEAELGPRFWIVNFLEHVHFYRRGIRLGSLGLAPYWRLCLLLLWPFVNRVSAEDACPSQASSTLCPWCWRCMALPRRSSLVASEGTRRPHQVYWSCR